MAVHGRSGSENRVKDRAPILSALSLMLVAVMALSGCISNTPSPTEVGENGESGSNATAENGGGNDTNGGSITVNMHPTAKIWYSSSKVMIGERVHFDARNSSDKDGTIVAYTWDFDAGDGISTDASGVEVNHTYNLPGTYTVTLIVEDDMGATDTAQAVITVINQSEEGLKAINVQCDEGNEGEIYVPINPTAEGDKKHHWTMPANVVMVKAMLKWSDTTWSFEYSTGTGECPDNGEVKATSTSSSGLIVLEYTAPQTYLEEGQWFVHIRTANPDEHTPYADRCQYTITIIIYQEVY